LLCLARLQVQQFHSLGWVRMSFAFQRGRDLDGPDAADGSIPRRGSEQNLAFRKPKALRIVRAMEGAQGQAVPKVRRVFKALRRTGRVMRS
jgi:hypothetical protein